MPSKSFPSYPRWVFTVLASLGLLVLVAAPAGAVTARQVAIVYFGTPCTQLDARTDDGSGGSIYTQTYSYYLVNGSCHPSVSRPAGYIAVQETLYHWNPVTQAWDVCNAGAVYYNQTTTDNLATGWYFNRACGSGYYGNQAQGWTYNGGWNGGGLWSGYVLL